MEISRHWRLKNQRYRLQGSICPTCGEPSFPPRPTCLRCVGQRMDVAATGRAATQLLSGITLLSPDLRLQATESTTG